MIKLENYEVVGWEHAIRGMRNPKNSWDRSDSAFADDENQIPWCEKCPYNECMNDDYAHCINIGPNDHKLMMQLAKGGPVHAKYRRMIVVYVDISAPLYWWKEFDTYKVGTVANSCSTMHKIEEKEFTMDDFSHEHLMTAYTDSLPIEIHAGRVTSPLGILQDTIVALNLCRDLFLKTGDKKYWWQMIQLLPSSYIQKRTVMMSYEVLANIYRWRNPHKMDKGHWDVVIDWIESLPYSEIITGETGGKKDE
jgi:hypothetical protein